MKIFMIFFIPDIPELSLKRSGNIRGNNLDNKTGIPVFLITQLLFKNESYC